MLVLYKDEDGWIGRYFEPLLQKWVLGVEIKRWSFSKYKKYLCIFAKVLILYPAEYISFVKGEKEKKFNLLFGFKETGVTVETKNGFYEVMYAL